MIGIALAGIAFGLIAFLVSTRLIARERRESAREAQRWETERARLIDQMCNLVDKPWTPPPARSAESGPPPARPAASPDEELAVW